MESTLIWAGVFVSAVILGINGAYYGALADACLKIGKGLEGASEGTTGFQDAITPPASTNAQLVNWLATVLFIGGAWYFLGFLGAATFFGVRLAASIFTGATVKADPPMKHFCRKVYTSMSVREADYAKAGDSIRAKAIGDLRSRFEHSPFAKQLER